MVAPPKAPATPPTAATTGPSIAPAAIPTHAPIPAPTHAPTLGDILMHPSLSSGGGAKPCNLTIIYSGILSATSSGIPASYNRDRSSVCQSWAR